MKKRALALLLLAVLLLAGCKRSNIAQNFGPTIEEWSPRLNQEEPASKPRESDIVSYDTPDQFGDVLGFSVVAWPNSEALALGSCYAIDEWIGQMEYHTPDEWTLVLRVAVDGTKALQSVYNETHYHDQDKREVDGIEVRQTSSTEGCAIATWKKDGFQYSLHSNKLQGRMPNDMIDTFVLEVDTVSTL